MSPEQGAHQNTALPPKAGAIVSDFHSVYTFLFCQRLVKQSRTQFFHKLKEES